jgi:hypothetical protein
MLRTGPAIHQRERLAALLHYFETRDFEAEGFDTKGTQTAHDQETSRVVSAIEVAAANDAKGHV